MIRDAAQVESAMQSIDAGLSVVGGSKPTVRFHEGSRLLFVKGTDEQLMMVHEVINLFRQSPPLPPASTNDSPPAKKSSDR